MNYSRLCKSNDGNKTVFDNNSHLVNNSAVSCWGWCMCFIRQNSTSIPDADTPTPFDYKNYKDEIN